MDTVQNSSQTKVSAVLGCYAVLIGATQHCVVSLWKPEVMNSQIYSTSEVVLYVAECDRVPSTGNIAVSEKEDQPKPTSHHCQAVCSEKFIVVTPVIDCNHSKESSARTSGEVQLGKEETQCSVTQSLSVEEHAKVTANVESETQCDIPESETTSTVDSHSPPPSSPTAQHRIKPQVTESLQLVQRSEVILRVNAATSDAASQTESEREVLEVVSPLVRQKLQEEIECERLSLDLASHLPPSDKLQGLLGMNFYFFSIRNTHAHTRDMHAYTYAWATRQWLISDKNSTHQTF
jgi:hypothetical protein